MKRIFILSLVCLLLTVVVHAAGAGTGAQEMVEKAATFLKANGKGAAFVEFNKKNGKFAEGIMYIYVVDFKGNVLAHGGNNSMVGKNMYELKDSDRKPFMKEIIDRGVSEGSGWVDYRWPNLPMTNKALLRSAYFKKVKDVIIICSVLK